MNIVKQVSSLSTRNVDVGTRRVNQIYIYTIVAILEKLKKWLSMNLCELLYLYPGAKGFSNEEVVPSYSKSYMTFDNKLSFMFVLNLIILFTENTVN